MAGTTLNAQIVDAVDFTNYTTLGNAAAQSSAMLDALMAETVGMAMYNAVNTQQNAQMIGSAAVTAACARMLKIGGVPWIPPVPAAMPPAILSVAPVSGQANAFTATGTNFATGLTATLLAGSNVSVVTPSATPAPTATSFQFDAQLTAGTTAFLQVANPNGGKSSLFPFTVAAAAPTQAPSTAPSSPASEPTTTPSTTGAAPAAAAPTPGGAQLPATPGTNASPSSPTPPPGPLSHI